MADWIGQLIANWPGWAIIIAILLIGIGWFLYYPAAMTAGQRPKKGYWWQDAEKRKANEIAKRQAKLKIKKG